MKRLPFKNSKLGTMGIELEIQLIHPVTYDLASTAKDLMRSINSSVFIDRIKPEVTQSMIEINTSIHTTPESIRQELIDIRACLLEKAASLNLLFSGGGTHPFQKWSLRKIFPTKRFKKLSHQYRYLSKWSTVFGEHIHIGCPNAEDALYLTHAFSRYVPHFIALSASSPFYQGVDTGYHSSRSNSFNSFPFSGVAPYLTSWQEFSNYFYKMKRFGIVTSMKDFYWDIRPKPEFGTVEIRVCDTPLSIHKAVLIAVYAQSLALHLLRQRSVKLTQDLYYLHNYNRFQACRYGFAGNFINPLTSQHCTIEEDLLQTLQEITNDAPIENQSSLAQLKEDILSKKDDAIFLRQVLKQLGSLQKLVKEQTKIWMQD